MSCPPNRMFPCCLVSCTIPQQRMHSKQNAGDCQKIFFEQRNKGSDPKALTGKRAIRVPPFYFFLSCPWCSLWGRRPHADTNRAPNKSIKTWGRTIVAQTFGKINVCALCCSWSPDLNQMFQPLVGARCSIDWTNHPALGCNPLQRKASKRWNFKF